MPLVLGSCTDISPPNDMRAATRIIGTAQCTSTNTPKMMLPKMAAILAMPVCIPKAVDLKHFKYQAVLIVCTLKKAKTGISQSP